jgi:hypothetical protein
MVVWDFAGGCDGWLDGVLQGLLQNTGCCCSTEWACMQRVTGNTATACFGYQIHWNSASAWQGRLAACRELWYSVLLQAAPGSTAAAMSRWQHAAGQGVVSHLPLIQQRLFKCVVELPC